MLKFMRDFKQYKARFYLLSYAILLVFLIVSLGGASETEANQYFELISDQIKVFYIYDTDNFNLMESHPGKISDVYSRAKFNTILFKALIPEIKHKSGEPFRKGSYIGIIEFKDGTERLLLISNYGAFFDLENYEGFFYLEGDAEKKWKDEIHRIVEEIFIPNRRKGIEQRK